MATSQRVGLALVECERTTVYEALITHFCGTCGTMISPGQRFTMLRRYGRGHQGYPACQGCRPFVEEREREQEEAPSPELTDADRTELEIRRRIDRLRSDRPPAGEATVRLTELHALERQLRRLPGVAS